MEGESDEVSRQATLTQAYYLTTLGYHYTTSTSDFNYIHFTIQSPLHCGCPKLKVKSEAGMYSVAHSVTNLVQVILGPAVIWCEDYVLHFHQE